MIEHIPAGYQLHVTCYGGDADYYNTEILSGLTVSEVEFYLDILSNFQYGSYNKINTKLNLGNEEADSDVLRKLLESMLEMHPHISMKLKKQIKEYLKPVEDKEWDTGPYDWLSEYLLGNPQESMWDLKYYCHVFDSYKVYHCPIEIQDVTQQFMVKR